MKTMKTTILWAATAFLALTACENDGADAPWNGEIRLATNISPSATTKAFGLDTEILDAQEISFWVDDAKAPNLTVSKEQLYENRILAAGPNGSLMDSGQGAGTAPMCFPETGNKVNIYAIHPARPESDKAFPSHYTHTVSADQRTAKGYASSDLLYGARLGVERTSGVVTMDFKHLLTKVEVNLIAGVGTPSFADATITLEGLRSDVEFSPSKESGLGAIGPASGPVTPIRITSSTTEANEAIIIPQTWTADAANRKALIHIKLANGTVLNFVPDTDITFKSGKRYIYTVTANLTEIQIKAEIKDWGYASDVDGNATIR